jgi:hypothetical protein
MTHDELLAKLADNYQLADYAELRGEDGSLHTHQALRAVVQLHKPVMQWSGGYDGEENPLYAEQCSDCSSNGFTQEYPCETIQAIDKELG